MVLPSNVDHDWLQKLLIDGWNPSWYSPSETAGFFETDIHAYYWFSIYQLRNCNRLILNKYFLWTRYTMSYYFVAGKFPADAFETNLQYLQTPVSFLSLSFDLPILSSVTCDPSRTAS